MARRLGGSGKIGVVYHGADFLSPGNAMRPSRRRFKRTIPISTIVEEQGITGPDFAGDAEKVASAMLTKNADLNGIWAVWDVPAEGVVSAIRSAGRATTSS